MFCLSEFLIKFQKLQTREKFKNSDEIAGGKKANKQNFH